MNIGSEMAQESAIPKTNNVETAVRWVKDGMTLPLKCKIGSLAAEARFIRTNERRLIRQARRRLSKGLPAEVSFGHANRLRLHRVHVVRKEARAAHLAYAFLRGTPYWMVERNPRTKPDWKNVERIAYRHGPAQQDARDFAQRFAEWISNDTDNGPGHSV